MIVTGNYICGWFNGGQEAIPYTNIGVNTLIVLTDTDRTQMQTWICWPWSTAYYNSSMQTGSIIACVQFITLYYSWSHLGKSAGTFLIDEPLNEIPAIPLSIA